MLISYPKDYQILLICVLFHFSSKKLVLGSQIHSSKFNQLIFWGKEAGPPKGISLVIFLEEIT